MKTSSAPAAGDETDRQTAWACTVTNLFTLPGLGSLAAKKRVGYCQAVIALLGFVMSVIGLIGVLRDWLAQGAVPAEFTPSLGLGLAGVACYAVAWLWALRTSLGLLWASRERQERSSGKRSTG